MSDKSPRQSMTKKSGKSIKEKRADKRAKASTDLASSMTNTGAHSRFANGMRQPDRSAHGDLGSGWPR